MCHTGLHSVVTKPLSSVHVYLEGCGFVYRCVLVVKEHTVRSKLHSNVCHLNCCVHYKFVSVLVQYIHKCTMYYGQETVCIHVRMPTSKWLVPFISWNVVVDQWGKLRNACVMCNEIDISAANIHVEWETQHSLCMIPVSRPQSTELLLRILQMPFTCYLPCTQLLYATIHIHNYGCTWWQ